MVFDAGTLAVLRGANTAPPGGMPEMGYTHVWASCYAEKTVGTTRFYAAKQYGQRPDALVRIPRVHHLNTAADIVKLHPYAYKDENEYSILQIQQVTDDDGLPATDLSLQRVDIAEIDAEGEDGENP